MESYFRFSMGCLWQINVGEALRTMMIHMEKNYIRCEMTPTSSGGEEQISISGGSQSPI